MSTVAIFGDSCIDAYWVGEVKGLSAEAPIPALRQTRFLSLPGMAGNVAALLMDLGQTVVPIQPRTPHFPVKNRLMLEDGTQIARWDIEDWCSPYEDDTELPSVDAIIVSDYAKGSLTPKLVRDLLALAAAGTPLFVDTKQDPFIWLGENITLFPNSKEYTEFRTHYDWLPQVVAKHGAAGISYLRYGTSLLDLPATCASPLNVCGAGDAVVAAFTRGSVLGLPYATCLELANSAAGILVSQPFDQRYLSWEEVVRQAWKEYPEGVAA